MTEKTLSQELCEICGVEPETTWTDCSKDCDPCITPCGCDDSKEIKIYPDFTLPENFVKLLELLYRCNLYITINPTSRKNNCIEVFLSDLCEQTRKYKDYTITFSRIAQAIKEAEWIY